MKKSNSLSYLLIIFILGVLLRFYRLNDFPPSLNWDEVSHAYNAFSLLHTGLDQWGQFPIFNFRAYGDYPAALNLFFTVLPVAIFGATDFAVRFPHALIGSLGILTTFAAAYYWSYNKRLALFAALFICLDPWTLFPSRAIFQSNWAIFFLSLGLVFYFKNRLSVALWFWGVSLFAYHNTRIFIPLLIIPFLPQFLKNKKLLLPVLILYVPILIALLLPSTRARNTWVGIIDPGVVSGIESVRNNSSLPGILPRLVYNKPVYFLQQSVQHYLGYFSPQFLFFTGGTQYQFSLPGFGVLPWVSLPFFYLGLILLFCHRQKFLLYWLLLAPLPAAITRDSFAVIRATTMLPVVQITTAYGLYMFSKKIRFTLVPFLILLYVCLEQYLVQYVTVYPIQYSQSWQYGYLQVAKMADSTKYSNIIMTKKYGESHEYILWYKKILFPRLVWDYHSNWYWVDSLNNYRFVNDWEMDKYVSQLPFGKYLLIGSPQNNLPGTLIKRINFLDGTPAFIINSYEK